VEITVHEGDCKKLVISPAKKLQTTGLMVTAENRLYSNRSPVRGGDLGAGGDRPPQFLGGRVGGAFIPHVYKMSL